LYSRACRTVGNNDVSRASAVHAYMPQSARPLERICATCANSACPASTWAARLPPVLPYLKSVLCMQALSFKPLHWICATYATSACPASSCNAPPTVAAYLNSAQV
jgi:hypothetical protein